MTLELGYRLKKVCKAYKKIIFDEIQASKFQRLLFQVMFMLLACEIICNKS